MSPDDNVKAESTNDEIRSSDEVIKDQISDNEKQLSKEEIKRRELSEVGRPEEEIDGKPQDITLSNTDTDLNNEKKENVVEPGNGELDEKLEDTIPLEEKEIEPENGNDKDIMTDEVITPEIILENTEEEIDEVKSMFDTLNLSLDVKRIVLISDMHSNYEAFEAVWKDIQKREFDAILSLGDMSGYYTDVNEVIDLTKRISSITVQGNHDLALVSGKSNFLYTTLNTEAQQALDHNMENITSDNKKWLSSLPLKVCLTTPYATLTLVHGDPLTIFGYIYGSTPELFQASIQHALDQVETDYLVVGHSHIQGEFSDTVNNKHFVNPGSIGQPRDGDARAAYAIVDLEKRENQLIRVDYDISKTIAQIHHCQLPENLGSRLLSGQ